MTMNNKPANHIHSTGLGLTEVLISMLILSVGMLGMAGLQIRGLQASHDSYYRTQAVALVQDMADRMRTNILNVAAYDGIDSAGTYAKPGCLADNSCVATNMAGVDAYAWLNPASETSVPSLLLLGQGNITAVDLANRIFTITVMWDDDRQGTGTDCNGAANLNLTCYSMTFRL